MLIRWLAVAAVCTLLTNGCTAPREERPAISTTAFDPAQPEWSDESSPRVSDLAYADPAQLDGSERRRLTADLRQHTTSTTGEDFDPDTDPAGAKLIFASTRNSRRPDLFVKDVDGVALTQLTSDPADDVQPRFSPDGQRVAFASNRTGNWDIWVLELASGQLTQLTRDRVDEVAPCFSPDGTQVAFSVWSRRAQQWEIWTQPLESAGGRRFLTSGMFPAWSPDGTRLAFQRARQRDSRWYSIWTIELSDADVRYPTEVAFSDDAACVAPRWSPDGQRLVYTATTPGLLQRTGMGGRARRADLWTVHLASGQRQPLSQGAFLAFNPSWSGKGRVFFVNPTGASENIWSMPALTETTPPDAAPAGGVSATPTPAAPAASPAANEPAEVPAPTATPAGERDA